MKKTVYEFEYKIEAQKKFIEYYKERYPWMFNYDLKIEKPKIPSVKAFRRCPFFLLIIVLTHLFI